MSLRKKHDRVRNRRRERAALSEELTFEQRSKFSEGGDTQVFRRRKFQQQVKGLEMGLCCPNPNVHDYEADGVPSG